MRDLFSIGVRSPSRFYSMFTGTSLKGTTARPAVKELHGGWLALQPRSSTNCLEQYQHQRRRCLWETGPFQRTDHPTRNSSSTLMIAPFGRLPSLTRSRMFAIPRLALTSFQCATAYSSTAALIAG